MGAVFSEGNKADWKRLLGGKTGGFVKDFLGEKGGFMEAFGGKKGSAKAVLVEEK